MPEQLEDQPPLPVYAEPVWNAFCELSETRSAGMSGPGPIAYSEIQSYQAAHGIRFAPWEIEAVRRLDQLFRTVMGE